MFVCIIVLVIVIDVVVCADFICGPSLTCYLYFQPENAADKALTASMAVALHWVRVEIQVKLWGKWHLFFGRGIGCSGFILTMVL